MPAEGPDAVETPGTASPPPSSPPLPTSLAPDDDARARSLAEADALSETLRVLAEATDALPEGALAKTRVLAAKFRLRSAKAHTLETSAAPESVPSSDWCPSENLASSSEGAFAPPKERAERLFAAELRRSRAVADAVAETVSFWALLENDENTATRLLHAALCVALRGNEDIQFDGARKFAARYAAAKVGEALSPSRMHVAANSMIQFQSSVSFGAGFVTGLGGLLTLPVTLPANVAANMVTNLRLAFAVAVVGGHDPMRPSVAAAAIAAALGLTEETDVCSFVSRVKGDDVVRGAAAHLDDGTSEEDGSSDDERESPAEKTKRREALEKRKRKTTIDRERSKRLIDRSVADGAARAALRGNAAVLQGTAWRMARTAAARLATKGATRTTGVAAARAIPFLGGFVGGGFDAAAAVAAGGRATRRFLPPKPTRVDADESRNASTPAQLASEIQKLSVSASEGVERLGTGFANAFRGASAAMSDAFESATETWSLSRSEARDEGNGFEKSRGFDANAPPSYQAGGLGSAREECDDARADGDESSGGFGVDFDVFAESEARWEREAARLAAARAEAMARRAEALDAARARLDAREENETTPRDADASGSGSKSRHRDFEETRASRRARRWARHEKRWLAFANDEDSTRAISYDDVPWPPSTKGMLSAAADAEMADDETEQKETDELRTKKRFVATRRAYRRLVLRWHADKFAARFSARLADADADLIMARVGDVSRAVVEQWSRFVQESTNEEKRRT